MDDLTGELDLLDPERQVIKLPWTNPIDYFDDLGKYNWRAIDPAYACLATSFWVLAVTLYVLYRLPQTFRLIRAGRAWQGRGIWSEKSGRGKAPVRYRWPSWLASSLGLRRADSVEYSAIGPNEETPLNPDGEADLHYLVTKGPGNEVSITKSAAHMLKGGLLYIPTWSNLEVGHILLVIVYTALILTCTFHDWDSIISFPNRAGFTALCQLPLLMLFGSKNSILTLFIGQGHGFYFNFLHRWSGRCMFGMGSLHSVLWVFKRFNTGRAERLYTNQADITGIIAFFVMCVIVVLSLPSVRRNAYRLFFASHVASTVALFILLFLHTKWKYTSSMLSWSAAFYATDLVFRALRTRMKQAQLEAIGDDMTMIHIPDCGSGWAGGQHINIRFLRCPDLKESHAFTILNAPEAVSAIPSERRKSGILLAARVMGKWTKTLNDQALSSAINALSTLSHRETGDGVSVLIDGPYSSLVFDCGQYENIMFVAGGSGATFAIGLLDDIVGRVVKHGRRYGERTRHIEFIWYIRTISCISWFSSILSDISGAASGSSLTIHFQIYVTRQSDDVKSDANSISSARSTLNADIEFSKPSIGPLLHSLLSLEPQDPSLSTRPPSALTGRTPEHAQIADPETASTNQASSQSSQHSSLFSSPVPRFSAPHRVGGGVGVAACGPSGMCHDVQNAVATINPREAALMGGVDVHAETFAV